MEINVFGSGSKGNAILIKSKDLYFLIDCGLTKNYILNCLNSNNLNLEDISMLLITHEHIDHIRSLNTFKDHLIYSPKVLKGNEIVVKEYKEFNYKHLNILPLKLSHDTDITFGYIIDDNDERVVYITDTGYISLKNLELIKNCDRYIFESNYDLNMLYKSSRPLILKERINSNYGHLSNEDSANYLCEIIGDKTKEIILAHISQECNKESIALYNLKKRFEEEGIDYRKINIWASKQYNYNF